MASRCYGSGMPEGSGLDERQKISIARQPCAAALSRHRAGEGRQARCRGSAATAMIGIKRKTGGVSRPLPGTCDASSRSYTNRLAQLPGSKGFLEIVPPLGTHRLDGNGELDSMWSPRRSNFFCACGWIKDVACNTRVSPTSCVFLSSSIGPLSEVSARRTGRTVSGAPPSRTAWPRDPCACRRFGTKI